MSLAFRLPWSKITLASPLSLAEARRALSSQVDEKTTWSFFVRRSHGRPFHGNIRGDDFAIVRIIQYRNSFIPVILGRLRGEPTGTSVEIRMRMTLPVCLFMGLWMVMAGLGGIAVMVLSILNAQPIGLVAPLPFAFGGLLVGFGFGSEATTAERLLRDIFKSVVIEATDHRRGQT